MSGRAGLWTLDTEPMAPGKNDVVELELLLTREQVDRLEQTASLRGETMGQLIRRLVLQHLHHDAPAHPDREGPRFRI